MTDSLEREVRELRSFYWSERDPDGRGFAPLADAYRRSGDLEGARELLAEGLERHPEFASGHVVAARVHLAEGDKQAAADSLRRVLELDDENTEALWTLGSLTEEAGDQAAAFDLFKRLAVIVPDDAEVLDRMRSLESELESVEVSNVDEPIDVSLGAEEATDESIPVTETTIEGAHEDPGVARELEELEELGGEGWDFEPGDAPAPGVPEEEELYTRTLAELYADQGLFERAADVFRHLIEADPDDTDLRSRLAEVESRVKPMQPAVPPTGDASEKPAETTDLDEIAAELATGPSVTGDFDTPFAWPEQETPPEPANEGAPIADHLSELLSWPAPEAAVAPDQMKDEGSGVGETAATPVEEPVSIDALAPDGEETGVDRPAEEPVPVAFLAPDPAGEEVVSIDALAPDEEPSEESEVSDQVAKFRDWMRRLGK